MRISSTLSQVAGNFARPTKYSVIVTPPFALREVYGNKLDVLCKGTSLPEITVESQEIKIKGHPIKIPKRVHQNQEITLTFYIDEKYDIRSLFQNWIYALDDRNPVARNLQSSLLSDTNNKFGELTLIARDFNETTSRPIQWIFEDAFPISISDIEFSSDNKDAISEMSVTFGYTRYLTHTTTSREYQETEGLSWL